MDSVRHNPSLARRIGEAVFGETITTMKTAVIKRGLTSLGVLCALAGVTTLLTVLFSFLGNLSCAVLSGMIVGVARRWQWQAIPISLVFPAVILGLTYSAKLELPPGKVHLVAIVCGAAFWGVYGMTFGMYFLEKKQEGSPGNPAETVPRTKPEFHLATLHGSWTYEDPTGNGSAQCKTLWIEEGKFALTVSERGGRRQVIARGKVCVDRSRTDHPVVTFNAAPDSPGSR